MIALARRPVLLAIARALGEAWSADVPRSTLVSLAFGATHADASDALMIFRAPGDHVH
jgi:hypothetical protein